MADREVWVIAWCVVIGQTQITNGYNKSDNQCSENSLYIFGHLGGILVINIDWSIDGAVKCPYFLGNLRAFI